jgi:hypothetical protein
VAKKTFVVVGGQAVERPKRSLRQPESPTATPPPKPKNKTDEPLQITRLPEHRQRYPAIIARANVEFRFDDINGPRARLYRVKTGVAENSVVAVMFAPFRKKRLFVEQEQYWRDKYGIVLDPADQRMVKVSFIRKVRFFDIGQKIVVVIKTHTPVIVFPMPMLNPVDGAGVKEHAMFHFEAFLNASRQQIKKGRR